MRYLIAVSVVVVLLTSCTPEDYIRWAWQGTGQADHAAYIASRESMGDTVPPYSFDCAADNPRSSASGLFQTLDIHAPRAQRLKLAWSDVTGPECLADVLLAFDLWKEQGWKPWRL